MSYTQFTVMERAQIEFLHQQGHSHSAIGRMLGRHASSVGRELTRNSTAGSYGAEKAQALYEERRKACRPKGRLAHEPLREYVEEKIAVEELSPELVSGCLQLDFPQAPKMRVCPETLYSAIYANRHHLDYLQDYLPQKRRTRQKRGQQKGRRGTSIPNRVGIEERPAAVEERKEIGHWEGDLVVGKGQDGFIVTRVERTSRLLEAVKVQSKRAKEVSQAVIQVLMERPISWVKSITFDNGTEFSDHQTLSQQLGVDVYFADPYAAYQRGSNEQVNGRIRRYLPKGTSFQNLTQDQIDYIVERINNRPRKCLGFRTPAQVFQLQRQTHLCALRT